MAQQIINIGTSPNDGTGDPLRTAMTKVVNNFAEVYSGLSFTLASNNATAVNNFTVAANTTSNNLTVTSNATVNNINITTKLQVGNAVGYNFGSLASIEIDASQNTYVQSVIQNANSGVQATGDLVITADTGNDSVNYVDLGINSSTYSNTNYTISGALDAYLYSSNSNLIIGTAANNGSVIFHSNGTLAANERMRISGNGNIGIGNTTPANTLSVTGTFSVSANVYIANTNLNLGSSSKVANNGYTYLPNGLIMQWGQVIANTSSANVTFTVPYTTNAYSISLTAANSTAATNGSIAYINGVNSTVISIRSANATTGALVNWTAIGS